MIPRRQFLGSMAAFCVATSSAAPYCFSRTPPFAAPRDLQWDSHVIETIPHHTALRPPVVTGVSLQRSGDLMAIVGDDHVVCLFDNRQQVFAEHLKRHTDWVRATSFSPDGTMLATAGNDRTLMIWNTGQWDQPAFVKRHPEAIIHLAFSNDGTQLTTVGFDSWLRVYDVRTGKQVSKAECPCPDNHAVAYSVDDRMLAVGGRCGTIRVWNTADHTKLANFKAHRQRIRSLEFTPDQKIVSAGDDRIVRISDPLNPDTAQRLPRHAAKLYATALLSDGLVATAGSDNLIHIWQLSNQLEIGTLKGHTGTVTSLAYANGQLVSGSYDTHVRVWNTQQHTTIEQRHTDLSNGWNPALK
jgi:WD40 repeat protein